MSDGSRNTSDHEGTPWGQIKRLEFIDFRLYWEGRINRKDLTDHFRISIPQASADISKYQEAAPGNMDYDKSEKHYFATPRFKPIFIAASSAEYLAQLRSVTDATIQPEQTFMKDMPAVGLVPVPGRSIEPEVLRIVVEAIRSGKALHIEYQSMNQPDPQHRWITPHALAYDLFRWHIRAYCHKDERFKDFLLSRILTIVSAKPHKIDSSSDTQWHRYVSVKVGPHPGLTDSQKRAIEYDYGMQNGKAVLPVRAALLFYFLKRLHIEKDNSEGLPKEQQIILLNRDEILKELS